MSLSLGHGGQDAEDRGTVGVRPAPEQLGKLALPLQSGEEDSVVFMLWGGPAQKKAALVDATRHMIVRSAHPSPLSARHGFFGSKPFSAANKALRAAGKAAIDWQIPDR